MHNPFRKLFQLRPDPSTLVQALDDRLTRARHLKDQLQLPEAVELLQKTLADRSFWPNSTITSHRPVFLGELGEALWQLGQVAEAITTTQQALTMVGIARDHEGIFAYTGNLYEYYRYIDDSNAAANCAERLAAWFATIGDRYQAQRYTRQAALVRTGEPRNRVVVEIQGQRYELDEVLGGIEGQVKFHFARNKTSLRPSEEETRKGEQAGSLGQYEVALAHFRQAARLDPKNPQPSYEAAACLMHLGQMDEALSEYRRTEELAPGWFHCRSEAWLAEQIANGRYDLHAFLALRVLGEGNLPPQQQTQLQTTLRERYSDLAPVHLFHGQSLRRSSQGLLAEQAFRRGIACAEEPDIRTRLLTELAGTIDSPARRLPVLEEAVATNGNLVAAATAQIMLAFL